MYRKIDKVQLVSNMNRKNKQPNNYKKEPLYLYTFFNIYL